MVVRKDDSVVAWMAEMLDALKVAPTAVLRVYDLVVPMVVYWAIWKVVGMDWWLVEMSAIVLADWWETSVVGSSAVSKELDLVALLGARKGS